MRPRTETGVKDDMMQPMPPLANFSSQLRRVWPPYPLYSSNMPDKFDLNSRFLTVRCLNPIGEKMRAALSS